MKTFLISAAFLIAQPVMAYDVQVTDVENVVKQYAQSVSCGYEEGDFRTRAIKVAGPANETSPWQDYYAVVWTGDVGCNGGSGANGAHMSVVAIRAGGTPVVLSYVPPISVPTRSPVNVAGGKGMVVIESLAYLEGDANCCPSGKDSFIYEFNPESESMVFQE